VYHYLVVLGEREAIAWVLREQRMAFPATRRAELERLEKGDRLLLYATRGAWHNPTRDRGRIIATARVTGSLQRRDEPIEIAGMRFHSECRLLVEGVVPYPGGLELQPLVPRLAAFPKPAAWSVYLRRALPALPEPDAELLEDLLTPLLVRRSAALPSYPGVTRAAAN